GSGAGAADVLRFGDEGRGRAALDVGATAAAGSALRLAGTAAHAAAARTGGCACARGATAAAAIRVAGEADDVSAAAPVGTEHRSPGRGLPDFRAARARARTVPRRLLERNAVPRLHLRQARRAGTARALRFEERRSARTPRRLLSVGREIG